MGKWKDCDSFTIYVLVRSSCLWGGYLGVVGGNDQDTGGYPCGFTQAGDGIDGQKTVGWDLEKTGRGECPQISGYPETGDVY